MEKIVERIWDKRKRAIGISRGVLLKTIFPSSTILEIHKNKITSDTPYTKNNLLNSKSSRVFGKSTKGVMKNIA